MKLKLKRIAVGLLTMMILAALTGCYAHTYYPYGYDYGAPYNGGYPDQRYGPDYRNGYGDQGYYGPGYQSDDDDDYEERRYEQNYPGQGYPYGGYYGR